MKALLIFAMTMLALPFVFPSAHAAEKPGDAIIAKLEKMKLPRVAFEDTTAEEALDFLRQRSVELDPEKEPARRGISFLDRQPSKSEPVPEQNPKVGAQGRIKLVAEDISVLAVLKEIGKQAKLDIHLTSIGIVISPPGVPPFPNAKGEKGEVWHTIYQTVSKPDK